MARASNHLDTIVVGAGAAGLAAAYELSKRGCKTLVLEAQSRAGGRIKTLHDPELMIPIELGAEFIHGIPESLLEIARWGHLTYHDVPDEHAYSIPMSAPGEAEAGGTELVSMPHFWSDIALVLKKIRLDKNSDQSFSAYLATIERDPELKRLVPIVRSYVEGFHGADLRFISASALARAADAQSQPDARILSRFSGGYDGVIRLLARGARQNGVEIRLNTVVYEVSWKPGSVEVRAVSRTGIDLPHLHAKSLILTLPLSLVQASVHSASLEGAIRFAPPIREKENAVDHLRMGTVMKVILRFRSRFWEKHPTDARLVHENLSRLSFLHHAPKPDVLFPTWWTQLPVRVPLLTGWTGGPKALELGDHTEEALVEEAIRSLSITSGFSRTTIESELEAWHYHDWQDDPYARGAYSYVGVNGLHAQRELARPIADTLFFAGEASHFGGLSGTVDGAIETGIRAAEETFQTLSSSTRGSAAA